MKPVVRVLLVVLAIPVLVFTYFFVKALADPQAEARMKARDAIELCRQEASRSALDGGSRQFVASTCEKMERDFTATFGGRP